MRATQEDDDRPGYSRLLNESILNKIVSQPVMSDLLRSKKQEEERATEVASSQVIVCGIMLQLGIHSRQLHIELAAVYVYDAVCTPVSLFATLESLQAIHCKL